MDLAYTNSSIFLIENLINIKRKSHQSIMLFLFYLIFREFSQKLLSKNTNFYQNNHAMCLIFVPNSVQIFIFKSDQISEL